ncbi:MAG: hypothetical protein GY757_40015, partial [bacterium]|nr:hypothetical protein [bacterium]
ADTGQKTSKGIFRIRTARTKSSLTLQTQSPVAPGKPLNYTSNTRHSQENPVPGNYIVKLVLEKFKNTGYEEVAEISQLFPEKNKYSYDFSLTIVPGSVTNKRWTV